LLLQGSIERTFANPGLKFDPWHGVFVHPQPPQRTVTLEGSGLVAHWTKRALQRNGFAVVVEPSEWIVRVETNDSNAPSWVLNGEVTLSGYGIEHLLLALNNNFRCPITESSARCKMEERPT
jgi:iron complex transport system ATP-binding protein